MEKLENYGVTEMNAKEIKKTYGGFLGIFCITGLLDGIKGNTEFHWGRCR